MQKSLKHLRETLGSIKWLKERHEYYAKELIRLGGEQRYKQTDLFYADVISKLREEIKELPIGYRYTGTFYLRKPYTLPVEFEEITGSVFMREDLVSWQLEKEDGRLDYTYYRSVYKEPNMLSEVLTREEAEPVYKREN